jgi:hypothetical protein
MPPTAASILAGFQAQRAAPTGPERSPNAPQEEGIEFLGAAAAGPTTGPASDKSGPIPAPAPAASSKKPFGLVWIVFYWIIAGLWSLGGGLISLVAGFVGSAAIREIEGSRGMFSSGEMSDPGTQTALAVFSGILSFHFGLLLLVACYGLWTFRRWGLSLARGLAIASVVLNVIVFFIIPLNRTTFLALLIGLVIGVGIVVYLYGSTDLRDRLQRYLHGGHLQGGDWQKFE